MSNFSKSVGDLPTLFLFARFNTQIIVITNQRIKVALFVHYPNFFDKFMPSIRGILGAYFSTMAFLFLK
jgi:hypothetical protein